MSACLWVAIGGNVTERRHREFALASGERRRIRGFNTKWMARFLPYICDGGSWAGLSTARLLGRLERGREAEPQSPESNRLDKDHAGMERRYRSNMSCCRCSRKATHRTLTISSLANAVVGGPTFELIPAPRRGAVNQRRIMSQVDDQDGPRRHAGLNNRWKRR
jgi:hypothetical protein